MVMLPEVWWLHGTWLWLFPNLLCSLLWKPQPIWFIWGVFVKRMGETCCQQPSWKSSNMLSASAFKPDSMDGGFLLVVEAAPNHPDVSRCRVFDHDFAFKDIERTWKNHGNLGIPHCKKPRCNCNDDLLDVVPSSYNWNSIPEGTWCNLRSSWVWSYF